MKWGKYQQECHRLLLEVFLSKEPAYKWLYNRFKVRHFADLDHNRDKVLLQEIYNELYKLSFKELDAVEIFKSIKLK